MSSSRPGVQGRILEVAPLAFYTHCYTHQLNLCVSVGVVFPKFEMPVEQYLKFLSFSTTHRNVSAFFEMILNSKSDSSDKAKLKDMCRMRWIQRMDAIATFFELYPFVVQTMQAMSTRSDPEWGRDGETVIKASGFF